MKYYVKYLNETKVIILFASFAGFYSIVKLWLVDVFNPQSLLEQFWLTMSHLKGTFLCKCAGIRY